MIIFLWESYNFLGKYLQNQLVIINIFNMNRIITKLEEIPDWKQKYHKFSKLNNLKDIKSEDLKHQNLQNYNNYIQSIIQRAPRNSKKLWVSFETKILLTYLNAICVLSDKKIENFNEEQWQLIYEVFSYKNHYSTKYEVFKNILTQQQQRRRWSNKQENLLSQVIRKSKKKNKWNNIARELFILSEGQFYRQGKHCRERYMKIKENQEIDSIQNSWDQQKNMEFLKDYQINGLKKLKQMEKYFSSDVNERQVKLKISKLLQIENIQAENSRQIALKLQHKINQLTNKIQRIESIQFSREQQFSQLEKIDQIRNSSLKQIIQTQRSLICTKMNVHPNHMDNNNVMANQPLYLKEPVEQYVPTCIINATNRVPQPLTNVSNYGSSNQINGIFTPNFYNYWQGAQGFENQFFFTAQYPFGNYFMQ